MTPAHPFTDEGAEAMLQSFAPDLAANLGLPFDPIPWMPPELGTIELWATGRPRAPIHVWRDVWVQRSEVELDSEGLVRHQRTLERLEWEAPERVRLSHFAVHIPSLHPYVWLRPFDATNDFLATGDVVTINSISREVS